MYSLAKTFSLIGVISVVTILEAYGKQIVVPPQVNIVQLEVDDCHFFMANHATYSDFFVFLPHSDYLRISRQHMFVEIFDEGKWKQGEDGVITLVSRMRFRDIEYDEVRIILWHRGPGKFLDEIEQALVNFLDNNLSAEFKPEEIRKIYQYESILPKYKLNGIEVDYEQENIQRQTLVSLLEEIEEYKKAEDHNEFKIIPLKHMEQEFIFQHGHGTFTLHNLSKTEESYDPSSEDAIKITYASSAPTRISRDVFIEGVRTTQPFLFYPEVNDVERPALEELGEITGRCPESR